MFSNLNLNLNLTDLLNTTCSIIPLTSLLHANSTNGDAGTSPWEFLPGTTLLPFTFTILLVLYITLYSLQTQKSHPSEPEILPSRVPFIGHILGMALHGGAYVKSLGVGRPDLPIFTLPVPRSRIYIVTDPILAAAVQRSSKALSFTPLVPDLTKRILGLDPKTVNIIRQHLDPEPGQEKGFLADIHDLVYSALGPGIELDELSLKAVRELAQEVDDFVGASFPSSKIPDKEGEEEEGKEVNLLHWIRHLVTVATAKFLYGPENPITSEEGSGKELERAFWEFDNNLGQLLLGIFPSITARKPYYAREKLAAALAEYLESGKHQTAGASRIVQRRVEIALRHGWELREVSRSEVSFLFAGIVNTATTSFWIVLQLFASSGEGGLLEIVRRELEGVVVTTASGTEDGKSKRVLSLENVKNGSACPTLMAVFRECLRVGSDNSSTRLVKGDTMLAGEYFLKKGSVVQIAGGVLHADARIWGGDASVFNPGRFLAGKGKSTTTAAAGGGGGGGEDKEENIDTTSNVNGGSSGNVHPAAFRAFGGGKTLCPGRHFATNEILAFVAILVLTFDLEPVGRDQDQKGGSGKGRIRVPEKIDNVLPVHILEPREDVFVRVRLRDERRIEVVP